ncbi:MerR family transcriptional regulator [Cohnella sp. CIP 111063]|uniref:MerR family transcriptional regulator n=1 Tax=unclassified Cohnella TaxID=2636738 RepID=UPI000B8BF05E|nr:MULTISPECIES: MerR family transcriptional regulator [unclassified Cohnella]OXS59954.1 MerR family transcriptional regulator [Cohnella sp. CIP 111063]PRX72764.1 DNA-binding transcriptional MerR regulator [Cohnella sp. SGD-V74]
MEYTVQKLGRLAGISTRTLRYYDEIGLLKPARINSSGYRIYGQPEVDRLQQILFYRELDVGLEEIKEIVGAPEFDARSALAKHREQLLAKRQQLDALIANIDLTLAHQEGMTNMSDQQKFEGFKQQLIDDNEAKYGEEIRAKYGNERVNKSNAKIKNMTKEQHEEIERLSEDIHATLAQAFATGDPAGELAQKAADLHRRWLTFYWDQYTKEAHAGVAQMYVDDERFRAYYDKDQPGIAEFLRDAVRIYTGIDA